MISKYPVGSIPLMSDLWALSLSCCLHQPLFLVIFTHWLKRKCLCVYQYLWVDTHVNLGENSGASPYFPQCFWKGFLLIESSFLGGFCLYNSSQHRRAGIDLHTCATMSRFCMGYGDSDSCPHACSKSSLPLESSLHVPTAGFLDSIHSRKGTVWAGTRGMLRSKAVLLFTPLESLPSHIKHMILLLATQS